MRIVKSFIPSSIIIIFNLLLNLKFSLQDSPLPTHLTPEKYTLVIFSKLDNETPTFWGDVRITVKCNHNTKLIILHKKDLEITRKDVKIYSENSEPTSIVVTDHNYDPENDHYKMTLNADLIKDNKYEIFIPFEGKFSSDSTGYFLITRTYHNGSSERKKIFAVTHLGISDARRVFPCFDQMDMLAEFTIFLAHPESFISFSNMSKAGFEKISALGTWTMDRFAESTKIPPSAVAIALIPADFESKHLPLDSKIPLRIWGEKSDIQLPRFPSETLMKAFNYYAEYLTVPYAFPKLNVILFANFEISKGNNYDLIVVGRSCMIDPLYPSIGFGRFEMALNICHRMSHQWIGIYAPMSRRDENWLHEALALHFDVLCVNKVSPGWKHTFSDIHVVDTFLFALKNDQEGLTDKLLIAENDSHMTDTSKLMDAGFLRKAQHLIRMLDFFLGEKVFRRSINNYLGEVAMKNSNLHQLWVTFSEIAVKSEVLLQGLTIGGIMNSWITQKGCPLIIVTVEREKNRVLIEQKRFMLLDELNEKKPRPNRGPECWNIPLSYMRRGELESETVRLRKWITCDGPATINISLDLNEWILVNLDLNVLSRTSYDVENWSLLQKTLNSEEYIKISLMTRVRLVSDAFELAKVGLLQYKMLFDIVNYLVYENHFLPWKVASEELENIRTNLFETQVSDLYEERIRKILNPVFKNIDSIEFSRNDPLKNQLKRTILQLSCNFGLEACQELCTIIFNDWFESIEPEKRNSIPRNIRDIIYCRIIQDGNEKEWYFLWNQYNIDVPDEENNLILDALGCSSNSKTLEKYLEWSLDKKKVLPSDSFKIFQSLSKNKIGYTNMKNFFTKHLEAIYYLNNEANLSIDSYFVTLFDVTTKREDLYQLLQLAINYKKQLDDFDKIYNHNVNVATRNVLWLEKYEIILLNILKT